MAKIKLETAPKFTASGRNYVVAIDTPGVRPRDLKARLVGRTVTVTAGDKTGQTFTISVPRGVEVDRVDAEYVFGRLNVTLVPRPPVTIEVNISVASE